MYQLCALKPLGAFCDVTEIICSCFDCYLVLSNCCPCPPVWLCFEKGMKQP